MRKRLLETSIALGAIALLAACTHDGSPGEECQSLLFPGTRVAPLGIKVRVSNSRGRAIATGTSVNAVGEGLSLAGFTQDSLDVAIPVNRAGAYVVHATRQYYRDTTLSGVTVFADHCGDVQQTIVSMTLTPAPGAPPVRSVAVFGTDFLATPGSQAHPVAIVDAEAGVSDAVRWSLNDTLDARVDQSGVITAKCTTRGRVDTVTATSVAMPSVSGSALFSVGPSASCP